VPVFTQAGGDQRARLLLRAGDRRVAEAGMPRPADQRVLADVMDQIFAIAGGIPISASVLPSPSREASIRKRVSDLGQAR
jgi:hypothetical protein